jgi:hypothetical protein
VKVFISHSSVDQWIARQIGQQIETLGIEVFLDVKDLATGDDFDERIRDNLRQSDEMLLLISNAALRSYWVMMEFGAARALGMRPALILVGVSPNELPDPINRHLARDVNQIDRYYEELRRRLKSAHPDVPEENSQREAALITHLPAPQTESRSLAIGDRVRISEKPIDPDRWPVLSETMRQYLGFTSRITTMADAAPGQDRTFFLEVDNETFYWAERWLILIDPEGD